MHQLKAHRLGALFFIKDLKDLKDLRKEKALLRLAFSLTLHYLCIGRTKGCLRAEIIPSEPDTDNAGAGIV